MPKLLLLLSILFCCHAYGATVSGTITDKNGALLPFSSILIKGTTQGVSANAKGFYSVALQPGEYVLVCQFIGYQAVEKKIKVGKEDIAVNFALAVQQYDLKEVVVNAAGEDPAYAIIRKAIARRKDHLHEIKRFQCEVYLKGQLQLRDYPKKFFGKDVDFEDGDTSKRKMLLLSESIAKYSVEEPDKQKIEVLSTKVSGRSDGFGFSSPQILSFYENILSFGNGLNPRGFISPIADNALNYYAYKFSGTFYENGIEISRIMVTPKRAYEPLFTGYINIVENEWRIHSVQLYLLKKQQMQLLDTLKVEQLYVPAGKVWVIKQQVIYPSGKFFGFDFFGNFLQVYDKFDLSPDFARKFFDNTLIKFYDSSNKKTLAYWDSARPQPLLPEEIIDYKQKDSLEQVRKDPRYLDSLDKKRNKFTFGGLLFGGLSFSKQKKKQYISFEPLISAVNYNTVEGGALNISPNYSRSFEDRRSLSLSPNIRYGFANHHVNAHLTGAYNFGKKYAKSLSFSGGQRVFQFNNAQPITSRINSISTLGYEANYMKIYEAAFVRVGYSAGIGNGLTASASFQFQDRKPLENLSDMTRWKDIPNRDFTPNYPTDLTAANMLRNQASAIAINVSWQPGRKYIEYPDRKVSLRSKYPTLNASIEKGINSLFGSDVDYTKWRVSVSDNLNMKIGGRFSYRIAAGGFLNADKVFIPDYNHFTGNQTVIASGYLSSFQLAPYYKYSNTANLFTTLQAEYHLNGLLTNKIPGFRRLNWFLVAGGNALHINKQADYYEVLIGLENIFKIMRVDFVQGFEKGGGRPSGFRISLPFFLESHRED